MLAVNLEVVAHRDRVMSMCYIAHRYLLATCGLLLSLVAWSSGWLWSSRTRLGEALNVDSRSMLPLASLLPENARKGI